MKFILGTKKKMTQVFDEQGNVHPVTVVRVGPITVTQIKTIENDGYDAVQVGYGEKKHKKLTKPMLGHLKDLGDFRFLREFKIENNELKRGDKIEASSFDEVKKVTVRATSKGKGFQGVVKRHGFHGGSRSHGQKHGEREPGSIGATGPQRVFRGTRMGGRMGSDMVTVKNLDVIKINKNTNEMFIKGAVPGTKGSLVEIIA